MVKYRDLPVGSYFRFADGVNNPTRIYRKLRDNLAGYEGGVLSMWSGDEVEAVENN